ncbi:pilus assembly protein [Burkholderiaceae bacterium UC74_6]
MILTRSSSSALLALSLLCANLPATAQTSLADQPVFTSIQVPGNLALALSVEFPTALGVAHNVTYASASTYLGYFDPDKCYNYTYNSVTPGNSYFQPAGAATTHTCSSKWSGNFLNWATMQTIDPFRWALTGGYRSQDDSTTTILERAWASGQGGTAPDRSITSSSIIAGATPMSWGNLYVHVSGMGAKFRINNSGTGNFGSSAADMTGNAPSGTATVNFDIYARVKVCDNSSGAGGLEDNCKQYGTSYKPEGLIQQYSDRIRFSAFGYLTDSSLYRDAGVMRARMKFVGPTQPVPGSTPIANGLSEWSASTGIMNINPDSTDASTTATAYGVPVTNSGVMNYLNKFGSITRSSNSYKTYDPVSELYYAVQRYYRNVGNVPEWTNPRQTNASATTADITTYVDGFPVITTWDDPIQYACQKNFILGIGDVNTHADRNLPGSTVRTSEPSMPALVSSDTVNSQTWTSYVGTMIGNSSLATQVNYGGCCNNNGALMAGLAYWANTQDIRPDDANSPQTVGMQTIQTYYLDVLESGFETNNQFYLAAKYGGFTVPTSFNATAQTSDLPTAWWHTGDSSDTVGTQLRPDNYYTANRPDLMVAGLSKAFASIASKLKAYTTSFATATSQIASTDIASYASQYDAKNWTGDLVASTATLDPNATSPTLAQAWSFAATLGTQASGTGWDTGRKIITYNPSTNAGVPFRAANVPSTLLAMLDTSYRTGADTTDYLNYLRGDRSQEQNSTVSGSSQAYRTRVAVLGDIVNGKALPVGAPAAAYSDASNPGYATFKSSNSSRVTQVFAGANDGMLHVVDGSLTGSTAGKELFAYIPSPLFNGPTAPNTDGLAALGNPNFNHHYYVDSTPASADVDFGKTVGGSGTDWRTIVVGGLGKGGKAVYALDVTTTPSSTATETTIATKILWEYTDSDLGFTYGQPAIVKTKKYGWVVMFGAGYNNTSGVGALYILNPRTGALLEKISTGAGTTTNPAGLAQVQPFVLDFADGTADAVYAGDLLGNLWRFDVSAASGGYPSPTQLAVLKDASNVAQSVTSRPLIMVQPGTNKRYVTVGTGRALAPSDISSAQVQSFYAIIDGTAAAFGTTANLPSGVTYPIQRTNLQALTDLTQPVTINYASKTGWYLDLGTVGASSNWRVISDATDNYNSVIFSSTKPTTSDACNPSGSSRIYMINLGSGQSSLNGNVAVLNVSGVVTDISVITSGTQNKSDVFYGTDTGGVTKAPPAPGTQQPFTRLNWREIPLAN